MSSLAIPGLYRVTRKFWPASIGEIKEGELILVLNFLKRPGRTAGLCNLTCIRLSTLQRFITLLNIHDLSDHFKRYDLP
jgi:hypothetical protein